MEVQEMVFVQNAGKYLLIVLFLFGCAPLKTLDNRLMVFGDSISFGLHADKPYAQIVADQLNRKLLNFSIPGSPLVSRYQYETIMSTTFQSNDIVFYSPGTNDIGQSALDSNYWTEYQQDFDQIVDYIHKSGATLILGTNLKTLNGAIPDATIQTVGDYARNEVLRVNSPNVILIDNFANFSPDATNMFDQIHPNTLGHEQLAQFYLNLLL